MWVRRIHGLPRLIHHPASVSRTQDQTEDTEINQWPSKKSHKNHVNKSNEETGQEGIHKNFSRCNNIGEVCLHIVFSEIFVELSVEFFDDCVFHGFAGWSAESTEFSSFISDWDSTSSLVHAVLVVGSNRTCFHEEWWFAVDGAGGQWASFHASSVLENVTD